MSKLTSDLVKIAQNGGSIRVSSNSYMTDNLIKIAKSLTPQSKLILTDCEKSRTDNLVKIAKSAPGQIVFEFNS